MQWQPFEKVSLAVMWNTAAQTNLLIWLKSSKLKVSVVVPFKFNRLHVVVIKLGERCGGGGGGNEISLYLEGRAMLRKEFCVRFASMNLVIKQVH